MPPRRTDSALGRSLTKSVQAGNRTKRQLTNARSMLSSSAKVPVNEEGSDTPRYSASPPPETSAKPQRAGQQPYTAIEEPVDDATDIPSEVVPVEDIDSAPHRVTAVQKPLEIDEESANEDQLNQSSNNSDAENEDNEEEDIDIIASKPLPPSGISTRLRRAIILDDEDEDDNNEADRFEKEQTPAISLADNSRSTAFLRSSKHGRTLSSANVDKPAVLQGKNKRQRSKQDDTGTEHTKPDITSPIVPLSDPPHIFIPPSSPPRSSVNFMMRVRSSVAPDDSASQVSDNHHDAQSSITASERLSTVSNALDPGRNSRSLSEGLGPELYGVFAKHSKSMELWWFRGGFWSDVEQQKRAFQQYSKDANPNILLFTKGYQRWFQTKQSHLSDNAKKVIGTCYSLPNEPDLLKARIEYLLQDNRYTVNSEFMDGSVDDLPFFTNGAISQVLITAYYKSTKALGWKYPDLYTHVTVYTIAYVCALLFTALKQWETGIFNKKVTTESAKASEVYKVYITMLSDADAEMQQKLVAIVKNALKTARSKIKPDIVEVALPTAKKISAKAHSAVDKLLNSA